MAWLENRDKSKPFCLLLHPKAPHRNWMPETQYLDLYDDVEFPYPKTLFDNYSGREAAKTQEMTIERDMSWGYDLKVNQLKHLDKTQWIIRDWQRALERMTPNQLEAWNKAYDSENEELIEANISGEELVKWKYQRYIKDYMRCIKSLDNQVGRILEYLDKNGLTENTIIVYISDQGFYMGEHGWYDKRFMYEESFRTPILARFPKMMKKVCVTSEALVQNVDFAATYLSVAGVDIPKWMVGKSWVRLFESGSDIPKDWRKTIYYHYYDYPAVHMVRRHYGVFDGRYKLIKFYGKGMKKDAGSDIERWELFDLKNDSCELHNLYGDSRYKKVVEQLQNDIEEYHRSYRVPEF